MRDYPTPTRPNVIETLVLDHFTDDQPAGRVLGTPASDGRPRLGVDVEKRIAIDHGALRFQPLLSHGWGRQGIAYGPVDPAPGLFLAVAVTNGHNTSQGSGLPEDLARRLWRWMRGPGADPVRSRMRALLAGPRKAGLARRFCGWLRSSRPFNRLPDLDENLAVGLFRTVAPGKPAEEGCGFVVHAALGDNGEVWARTGGGFAPVLRRLQNIRVFYFMLIREADTVYYMAAGPEAGPLPALPMMRPVAVGPTPQQAPFHLGVHQAAIGQIGFRVDTRVHAVELHHLPECARTAPGEQGDALTGEGPLDQPGSGWQVLRGRILRTDAGAMAADGEALALYRAATDPGLIHLRVAATDAGSRMALAWRWRDADNHMRLELAAGRAAMVRVTAGRREILAEDESRGLLSGHGEQSLQVSDAAGEILCHLDGERLFGRWLDLAPEPEAGVAGLWFGGDGDCRVRAIEMHPSAVPVPDAVRFAPPWRRMGTQIVAEDGFGDTGGTVDGRVLPTGGIWRRLAGTGSLDLQDGGARVRASVEAPNPGRTLHAVAWADPDFADIETVIRPPGTGRGQWHHCRSGLLLWQDADNYLTFSIYLADEYKGASVALFPKRHGFEELYDAVWTMVGDRIVWGRPFSLRVTCDGNRFVVFVDGMAVLERALTDLYPNDAPLRIRAVGLATNWEWGDDTGSVFEGFTARH